MHHSKLMLLILALATFCATAAVASPLGGNNPDSSNPGTIEKFADNGSAGAANPKMHNVEDGGARQFENQAVVQKQDFRSLMAKKGITMAGPMNPVPNPKWPSGLSDQLAEDMSWIQGNEGAAQRSTAMSNQMAALESEKIEEGVMTDPQNWTKPAQAAAQAQATQAGNAAGEISRDQASSAIDFCAHYLNNFTTDGGNKWNLLRNNIFVPMGILLLLPGALLTQLRAIMAAGNPILGNVNPLEGIMRSVIAIFLIPATYLVVNYSIDLSNSITYTINSEYFRLFGSDMYKDAICAEIRAFPVRGEQENRNASDLPIPSMTPMVNPSGLFAKFEGMMENKIEDPCSGIYQAPSGRADEAMTSGSIAARLGFNGSNAALTASWNILCAFQMAYLYYLWFIGPIAAGLWVWPMKQLRGALPSWVEGVITLAFWSLFWNTAILLIACFKGVGETGCVLITALHFLATASVKHAFDFAGLVRAAGQEAANMAEKSMKSGGAGGGSGGGSSGGGASQGAGGSAQGAPSTADGIGELSSRSAGNPGNISVSASPVNGASGGTNPVPDAGLNAALNKSESVGNPSGRLADKGSDRADKASLEATMASMSGPPLTKEQSELFNQESKFAAPPREQADKMDGKLAGISVGGVPSEGTASSGVLSADMPRLDAPIDVMLAIDNSTGLNNVGGDSINLSGEIIPSSSLTGDSLPDTALAATALNTATLNTATLTDTANGASVNGGTSAASTDLPPSAAVLAEQQAKKDEFRQLAEAHAGDKMAEVAQHQREAVEAKRGESHAAQINNHLEKLGASLAAVNHVGAGVTDGGASVVNSMGSSGSADQSLSMLSSGLTNFDINSGLTVDSLSLVSNANNVSNDWVSNDSLTFSDFARLDMSNVDILGSVDTVDASVDTSVDNSLSAVANFDEQNVSSSTFAAAAAGNVTQYGDVTAYGGTNLPGSVDRAAFVSANAYTANAFHSTDSINGQTMSGATSMAGMSGNPVDASSVVSNAVHAAQSITGNPVIAAVENYNSTPAGTHMSTSSQLTANDYYAAQAASRTEVATAQSTSSYSSDYSTQSGPVVASSYSADYSTQSGLTAANSYSAEYSTQSGPTAATSYSADYSTQSGAVAATSYSADYSTRSGPVVANTHSADYSTQSAHVANSSQSTQVAANTSYSSEYAQNSPTGSSVHQQGTPVFASVLPSSTPADYVAPAQAIVSTGSQPGGNVEYYSAQAAPAPGAVASTNSYSDNSSSNSVATHYASAPAQHAAPASDSVQYSASQYAAAPTQYAAAPAQYVAQNSEPAQYAPTQYAPVQGQPSSFIQPSAPANEYYAAVSQSAPLVAALITPHQATPIEVASVQSQQQSYSNPVQYYLANTSAPAEARAAENVAPIERASQPSADVVYSRSNSEAYTTVAPYRHVESTESRPVSFAPVASQNVHHGPEAVTQYEAVLSQAQVHSKVQQAQGLLTRMNTILAGFDAPQVVSNSSSVEKQFIDAQPVAQNTPVAKKSFADLLPVQRAAKAAPKDEMVVAPPPMSNSWFDA